MRSLAPAFVIAAIAAGYIWLVNSSCHEKHCKKGEPANVGGECICVEKAQP